MVNRQALAPLLIGIISIMAGLWVGTQLRIDRCIDAGGRWDVARRICVLPDGSDATIMQLTGIPYLIGGLVTLAFAAGLLRMWAAIQKKNQLRGPMPPAR